MAKSKNALLDGALNSSMHFVNNIIFSSNSRTMMHNQRNPFLAKTPGNWSGGLRFLAPPLRITPISFPSPCRPIVLLTSFPFRIACCRQYRPIDAIAERAASVPTQAYGCVGYAGICKVTVRPNNKISN